MRIPNPVTHPSSPSSGTAQRVLEPFAGACSTSIRSLVSFGIWRFPSAIRQSDKCVPTCRSLPPISLYRKQIFLYFQPFLRWHWKSRQFNGLGKAIILPTVKPFTRFNSGVSIFTICSHINRNTRVPISPAGGSNSAEMSRQRCSVSVIAGKGQNEHLNRFTTAAIFVVFHRALS